MTSRRSFTKILLGLFLVFTGASASASAIRVVPVDKYAYAKIIKIIKQDKRRHACILFIEVMNNPLSNTTNTPYEKGRGLSANVIVDPTAKDSDVAPEKIFFGYVATEKGHEVWHITGFGEPAEINEKSSAR